MNKDKYGREHLKRDKYYPLMDRPIGMELNQLRYYRAKWDGEIRRPPKKGEYYLSGAKIQAYQAQNDLSQSYHIAKVVKVKELIQIIEVK